MIGEQELRRVAGEALRQADGDAAEAVIVARTGALTRFANSAIHQNVSSREAELRVRVVRGRRAATGTTERLDAEGVAAVARTASELARLVPEDPHHAGLPEPRPIRPAPPSYAERTAAAAPRDRAEAVKRVCDPARAAGLGAAGFVSTGLTELAVASTLGTWAYSPQTTAQVQVVAVGEDGSAFADRAAVDFGQLDVAGAADEAIRKAVAAQGPRDHPPGVHEVVLEPYAVRDIVGFLGSQLTGLAVQEGRSFVAGHFGERVTGPVTLVDDPYDPDGVARAFDYEGQPSDRLALIEEGVARAVVYDSATAHRTGNRNTGHALPAGAPAPASAMHLRLEPGTSARDELIRGVKRGLLVTRFHYTRWVHQLRTIVTGMTRDGTFAIEDGEVAYPVKNLRFTQSYHDALQGVRGIGRDLALLLSPDAGGLQASAQRVPGLRLASFAFTGVTQY